MQCSCSLNEYVCSFIYRQWSSLTTMVYFWTAQVLWELMDVKLRQFYFPSRNRWETKVVNRTMIRCIFIIINIQRHGIVTYHMCNAIIIAWCKMQQALHLLKCAMDFLPKYPVSILDPVSWSFSKIFVEESARAQNCFLLTPRRSLIF